MSTPRGRGRGRNPARARGRPGTRWWAERLVGVCDPITLEPLSDLAVPPFELSAAPPLSTDSDWFDAQTLAMYLVARAHFSHPISRRALDETDCARLDAHLRRYLPHCKAEVTRAYAHRQEPEGASASAVLPRDLVTQREELAASLRTSLFRLGSSASSNVDLRQGRHAGARSGRQVTLIPSSRIDPGPSWTDRRPIFNLQPPPLPVTSWPTHNPPTSDDELAVRTEGNLAMVDDDFLPGHLRDDSHRITAANRSGSESAARRARSQNSTGYWPHLNNPVARSPPWATAAHLSASTACAFPDLPATDEATARASHLATRTARATAEAERRVAAAAAKAAAKAAAAAADDALLQEFIEYRTQERRRRRQELIQACKQQLRADERVEQEYQLADAIPQGFDTRTASACGGGIMQTARTIVAALVCRAVNVAFSKWLDMRLGIMAETKAAAELASSDAGEASRYSKQALHLARARDSSLFHVERCLDLFVLKIGERKSSLPPMPRAQRKLVHELAHLYHIATVAHGTEPYRYIDLIRTPGTAPPAFRLSELVTYEAEIGFSAPARTVSLNAGPDMLRGCAEDEASTHAEPREGSWCMHLVQVQCAESMIRSAVRASHNAHTGLVNIKWLPERKADRQAAREAMRLEAHLHFENEEAARNAAAAMGGGRRGAFRVHGVFPSHPRADELSTGMAVRGGSASQAGSINESQVDGRVDDASDRAAPVLAQCAPTPCAARHRGRRTAFEAPLGAWISDGADVNSARAASESAVAMLLEMGFPKVICCQAVGHAEQSSHTDDLLSAALDWLERNPSGGSCAGASHYS